MCMSKSRAKIVATGSRHSVFFYPCVYFFPLSNLTYPPFNGRATGLVNSTCSTDNMTICQFANMPSPLRPMGLHSPVPRLSHPCDPFHNKHLNISHLPFLFNFCPSSPYNSNQIPICKIPTNSN